MSYVDDYSESVEANVYEGKVAFEISGDYVACNVCGNFVYPTYKLHFSRTRILLCENCMAVLINKILDTNMFYRVLQNKVHYLNNVIEDMKKCEKTESEKKE